MQWPLQLKMPTLESDSILATPHRVGTTLLKRHKILPHPHQQQRRDQEIWNDLHYIHPKQIVDASDPSPANSASQPARGSSSAEVGEPRLPLTPPTHSRQSSSGYVSFNFANGDVPPPAPSVPGTPVNQRSPPTPDVTPPKTAWRNAASGPLVNEQYPASRADSFKTAKETQTPNQSDDGDFFIFRPAPPSSQPSSQETVQWAPMHKPIKPTGLSPEPEFDSEGSTTPRPAREFLSFAGERGSGMGDVSEVEFQWDDNLMRNVTVRKRQVLEAFNKSPCPTVFPWEVYGDSHTAEPSYATKQLRNAVHDSFEIAMPDARRFSNMSGRSKASTIVEAIVVDTRAPKQTALRRTKKRSTLRQVSTTEPSLREDDNQSELYDDLLPQLAHKNSRIPERMPRSRGSSDTGGSISKTPTSGQSRQEVLESGAIPVVVIPERTTSSNPSKTPSLRSTSRRHTKGSRSVSATSTAPISSSIKTNETGYFDVVHRRRERSTSEAATSMLAHANGDNKAIDIESIVPLRTSSLSATTSRENSRRGSRTASLTAESLRAHNESQGLSFPPHSFLQLHKQSLEPPQDIDLPGLPSSMDSPQAGRKSLDRNGDPFFGNRRSTQVTPFSQISYGTSGMAAEVSEALAISLFPHRNKSLRLVNQRPNHVPPSSKEGIVHNNAKEPPDRSLVKSVACPKVTDNGKPTFGPPATPQPIKPLSTEDEDSLLRNPRQVPAIKFIPPTPASTEEDRQLGDGIDLLQVSMLPILEAEEKPKRGLSLVRRALSKRRYSDGFFLVGLGGRYSNKDRSDAFGESPPGCSNVDGDLCPPTENPSDASRLHPFWRPARENEQHSEDEENHDPRQYGRVHFYPSVETRPALPRRKFSLKRTFAILPLRDGHDYLRNDKEISVRKVRRSPSRNMRVVKKTGSKTSLRRVASHVHLQPRGSQSRGFAGRPATSDGFGASGSGSGNGRIHTIPGIGIRYEYVGLKGLQARLRERNNKKLKSRISAPREA